MTQDQPSQLPSRRVSDQEAPVTSISAPTTLSWTGAPAGPTASLSSFLNSFLRHKWLILLCTLLGIGGSYLVWTNMRPTYEVVGRLWIPSGDPAMSGGGGGGGQGPIQTGDLLRASSWVELLRSFAVLDSVAIQERLYVRASNPEHAPLLEALEIGSDFIPGNYRLEASEDGNAFTLYRDDEVVDTGAPGDLIGESQNFFWRPTAAQIPPASTIDFSLIQPRDASVSLREAIEADVDVAGSFIVLRYEDSNPRRAAAVINGVMDRTVLKAAELTDEQLRESVEVLDRQMAFMQNELASAEAALEMFRIQTITLPSDNQAIQAGLEMTRDPVFGRFFDMRVEEQQTRSDRERLEEALASFPTAGISTGSLAFIPAVAGSEAILESLALLSTARVDYDDLRVRYTANHPDVIAAAERVRNLETVRIPSLVSDLIRQLRGQEAYLGDQLAQSGQDLTLIPSRTIEEARLSRNVLRAETLFLDLQSRYQTQSLAMASSIPDLRILDNAVVPTQPSNDERLRFIAVIMMAFIGLGLGLAILIDRFDPRLRTPQQLLTAFGLTVLGVVPRIRRSGRNREIANIDQVHEAFRELRTGIDFAYGFAGPIVLTVTSSGASEGKTLVTSNLGVSFSELRRRTLLIDADTRRGTLHSSFGVNRRPGLTDYLMGHATLDDVIQPSDHAGLDIIPMGTLVAESPELLSSPMMRELIAAVRLRYEVIIVDSPPLGAGADPLVLSVLTGHLLMVVRSGSTDREFTQAKLEPLGRLPVRFLGVVLNDYIPDRLTSSRYYAAYLPGYEARSEDPTGDQSWTPKAIPSEVGQGSVVSGTADESDSKR